jgi:hypothetical protein
MCMNLLVAVTVRFFWLRRSMGPGCLVQLRLRLSRVVSQTGALGLIAVKLAFASSIEGSYRFLAAASASRSVHSWVTSAPPKSADPSSGLVISKSMYYNKIQWKP